MVSKTAKIIAFFLILGLITPSGVLAQENPWMITVFNNVSDIPEEPNPDLEFNGITIIHVARFVFMPENRIKPLDFKDEFTVESVKKNQADFKDELKDELKAGRIDEWDYYYLNENITFKEYPDKIDEEIFFNPFLDRHPFMRLELNPIEFEIFAPNNLAMTGKIRVHATIFKNGFCLISLVFPIVTKELKDKYKLKGDFLVADKPLKPDDVVSITEFRTDEWIIKYSLNEVKMTLSDISISRQMYLEHVFFFESKDTKICAWSPTYCIYSWNTSKTVGKGNSTELLKENPWDIEEIMHTSEGYSTLKTRIFSMFSEVYATYSSFHIFSDTGHFTHDVPEPMTHRTMIEEYGYEPYDIRLAEVVFLQEYMLTTYNDFVTEKLEELGRKNESEYQDVVKEIARFRKEISIALDEFYLIEDSLRYHEHRYLVRYGKQKRNLDFMHEILRVKMEDLSKISVDMNNVIMQENNAVIQQRIELLTSLGILLAFCLFFGNMYSEEIKTKLRRLRERKAKK
uniref:Uncharacterized protein n=1 Tax=Candidatus Methanophaga sp. ANME-1 ERB7 TaxID=2759913 RepID=A0A7G9Z914_9EURY|nr:hypothetical protein HGIILDEE_00037 [Methanosarcinales archaeon ANME-1 ERB7]